MKQRLFVCLSLCAALSGLPAAAAPGDIRWVSKLPDSDCSSPSIAPDGTIYVFSSTGVLFAVDGATGALKWDHATSSQATTRPPAIAPDGTVYTGLSTGELEALDGATGQRKWVFSRPDSEYPGFSTPSIHADGTLYSILECGDPLRQYTFLYALDGATGQPIWPRPFQSSLGDGSCLGCATLSPAVGVDGTLYFGSKDRKFRAVDGDTGALKWEFLASDEVFTSAAIGSDGTVYFGTMGMLLCALDGTTGQKKWHVPGWAYTDPSIGPDETVYVATHDGRLVAFEGRTGDQKWEFRAEVPGSSFGTPAIGSDGTLYFGGQHRFYSIDAATGKKKWSIPLEGGWFISPALGTDGTVYFWSGPQGLYAVETSSTGGLADSPWPKHFGNNRNTNQKSSYAPRLERRPAAMVILVGESAMFSARIPGSPLPAFQWYFNDQPIPGATNTSFTITSVADADAGRYVLTASNHLGTVTTEPATLLVNNVTASHLPVLFLPRTDPVQIQITDNLNAPAAWTELTTVALAAPPTALLDPSVPLAPQRFYRAVGASRLALQLCPGWNLAGPVGAEYRIDYVDAPLAGTDWKALTTVTLTNNSQLFIDVTATNRFQRYYRTRSLSVPVGSP
ncbi:MAG: PQQ-binding-like beta-propeller repeat protein [Verrucomicrobiia bacterium]